MTPRQLAAAIRKGHTMIGENREVFYDPRRNCGCAIGAALAGAGRLGEYRSSNSYEKDAQLLGITDKLRREISHKHYGGMPRLAIADWLDTLEPETNPVHAQTFEDFKRAMLTPVDVSDVTALT